MYFGEIKEKKLKPLNAITIFVAKLNKNIFGIEDFFECTSFKDGFYSFEIFADEFGIKKMDISGKAFNINEQTWITMVNLLLLIVSDILKTKPDPNIARATRTSNSNSITITAIEAAQGAIDAASALAPHLGYKLQKHTDNEIYTLVPTQAKEWMDSLNFDPQKKNLVLNYYSFSGNLKEKRSILRELWLLWEPIRKEYEKSFKGTGSDISRVMNKYGIRHSDDTGIPKEIKENEKMIEYHYDHLFNQVLQAIKYMEQEKSYLDF